MIQFYQPAQWMLWQMMHWSVRTPQENLWTSAND